MAGNLGQLVVEIVADASDLNAKLKTAEANIKNTTGKISDYTTKIGVGMTAMGAAITGMFALMVKSSAEFGEEIYRTSERTGIAVETLSALKYVADQTESSFENLSTGLKFLNRNIYEATTGNVKMNEAFRTLGIVLKDQVTGDVLKVDEVFLKIADKFKDLGDTAAKTALSMQIFGRSGEGLIPILNLGSDEIRRLSDEAQRLGIVLTAENAKSIDEFSDSMKSLKSAFGGIALDIFQIIKPALEDFVKLLTNIIVKLRQFSEAHPALTKNILALVGVFGALNLALGPLVIALPPLITMFYTMDVAIAPVVGGILLIIAAIGALTLVVANAKTIWAGFMKFLEPTMEFWFGKKPEAAFKGFGGGETRGSGAGGGFGEGAGGADETISLVEKHAQKVKELNDLYLTGKMDAKGYYEEIKKLHQDGLDMKQQELEMLNESIDLERMATDAEYQRIYVMGEGIRTAQEYARVKAEMANQDQMDKQASLESATSLLQTLQSMHVTMWQGIFDFINMGIQKFSTGFSTALTSIILGTKKAGEAFKDFGKMMLEAIVEFFVQWAVKALIAMTLGKMLSGWVMAQADLIAMAWLPAAIFASIATLGGADAAGAAGMTMAAGAGAMLFAGLKGATAAASVPELAVCGAGGIVTQPTLALIGEKGPEAVIPLEKMGNNITNYITIESPIISSDMDITDLAERLGDDIKTKMKRA